MAKSRARYLAELLNSEGLVQTSLSALAGADGIIDLEVLPTIPNSQLEHSSVSIAGHSLSLGGSLSLDTEDIGEHASYLYFTNARARAALSVSGSLSYDSATGIISYTTPTTISSLSNHTTDGLTEGSTNLYYTSARANTDFDTRLATKSTTNLSEGTNLYYTSARFDTAFSGKSTTDLSEGTNLYFTNARARSAISVAGSLSYDSGTGVISYTTPSTISSLSNHTTDGLTEGSTNLYYTSARANADFDTRLATKSTTNLAEGTNLYYTDARVGSYLSANSYATQSYVSTAISNLVDSAPATLDTLNELAAALGDDPNFATTVTNSIATKWTQDNTKISNWDTAYSWGDHASAGYLTNNTYLLRDDNRVISPSEYSSGRLAFGFTSWGNNNTSPYADFLHMRSYTDSSGGADNLLMLKKNGIGMRLWQQTYGSATAYSSYVDVWHTGNDGSGSGLDADLLDGQHGSYYAPASSLSSYVAKTGDTMSGALTVNSTISALGNIALATSGGLLHLGDSSSGNSAGAAQLYYDAADKALRFYALNGSGSVIGVDEYQRYNGTSYEKVWDSGNDGSGSGLDADLLDGQHGSYYAPASSLSSYVAKTGDTMSGSLISSSFGEFAGYFRVTQAGGAQTFLIGNQDSAGVNKPAIIMGVNGYLRFGHGNSWSGGGGTFTEVVTLSGDNLNVTSGSIQIGGTNVIDANRNLLNLSGSIKSDTVFAFLTNANAAQDIRTKSVFAGTSYGDTPPAGSVNATNTYELNGTTVIDASRNLVNIGTISSGAITTSGGRIIAARNGVTTTPGYTEGQVELYTDSNYVPALGFHRAGYSATTLYENDGQLYVNPWVTRAQAGLLLSTGNISTYAWTSSNDGSGSGLDADLLDGYHASSFLLSVSDSQQVAHFGEVFYNNGAARISSDPRVNSGGYDSDNLNIHWYSTTAAGANYGRVGHALYNGSAYQYLHTKANNNHLYINNNIVWNAGNDGAGSGLDADTLDGNQSSFFADKTNEQNFYAPQNIFGGTSDGINDATLYVTAENNSDWGLIVNKYNASAYEYGFDLRVGASAQYAFRVLGNTAEKFRINGNGQAYYQSSNPYWHSANDGSGSGLDADLLDGIDSTGFERRASASGSTSTVGWYTIAVNTGDRASAKFTINDVTSGSHQTVHFYASHFFGNGSAITSLHQNRYSTSPIRYIRIKEGSTYDGALLQIYFDATFSGSWHITENTQSSGWAVTSLTPDGTNPGGVSNFAALTNVAAQVDIDQGAIGNGGNINTTGNIYAGGTTSQNLVWHAGNDGSGSGLDADLLDGLDATTGATANTIAARDAGGDLYQRYGFAVHFNQSGGNSENPTIGQIWTQNTTDNYVRKSTPAHFISNLGLWTSANDGSGSGLDADLLDGLQLHTGRNNEANKVVRTDVNGYIQAGWINTTSGGMGSTGIDRIYCSNDGYIRYKTPAEFRNSMMSAGLVGGTSGKGTTNIAFGSTANSDSGFYDVYNNGTPTGTWYSMINMAHYGSNHGHQIAGSFYSAGDIYCRNNSNTTFSAWTKLWNSANDGSGSGLDADLLDGIDSSQFLRSDTTDTMTGQLNMHAAAYEGSITFGSNTTWRCGIRQHDDADAELRIWAKNANGMIFLATGYDGEPASIARPTDGLVVQGNNVGIGNFSSSDPGYKLQVNGTTYSSNTLYAYAFRGHSNVAGTGEASYHPAGIYSTGNNWLYGTMYTNGNDTYYSAGSVRSVADIVSDQNYGYGVVGVYSPSVYQHVWSMGASYRLAANGVSSGTGGNLYGLAWSYNPGYGYSGSNAQSKSGLNHQLLLMQNGTTTFAAGSGVWTNGNVTAYSDRRVKTNIEVIPDALTKVGKLSGYTFDRTDVEEDPSTGETPVVRQTGVIAQEVLEVLPEAVMGSDQEGYSVAYGNMVGLLIEAIKEQQQTIQALSARVEELENK